MRKAEWKVEKLLYALQALITCSAWVAVSEILFCRKGRGRGLRVILLVATLTGTRILMPPAAARPFLASTLILQYCCCKTVLSRKADSGVIAEGMIGYMLSEIMAIAYAAVTVIAKELLGVPMDALAVMAVEAGALCASLLAAWLALRKSQAEPITFKHAKGIILGYYILFLILLTVIEAPYRPENRSLNQLAFAIMLACLMTLALFVIYEYRVERLSGRKDARIRDMVSEVHQMREILPALKAELSEIRKTIALLDPHFRAKFEPAIQDAEGVIAEWEGDTAQKAGQIPLPRTGMRLLDRMLAQEREKAGARGIEFECAVAGEAASLLRTGILTQKKLLQLLGDLVSNALHAVEKSQGTDKAVLVVMGDAGPYYQLQIYDSGVYFEPFVLGQLGARGITTGGTGEGYADMLHILRGCKGSLHIEEFTPGTDKYTKCITVAFDGESTLRIQSWNPSIGDRVCDLHDIEGMRGMTNNHVHSG